MSFIARLRRFFTQFSSPQEERAEVALDELTSWCEKRLRSLVSEKSLTSSLRVYIKTLEHKRVYLEGRLGIWEDRLDFAHQQLRLYFSRLRSLLGAITFSDSFGESLRVHAALLRPLDELRESLEKSRYAHDFSFLLDEQEKGQVTMNPLIKEIIEMQGLVRDFEEKLSRSGLRAGERVTHAACALVKEHERVKRLEQELGIVAKRLEASEARSEEKKAEVSRLRGEGGLGSLLEAREKMQHDLHAYEQAYDRVISLFSPLKDALVHYHEQFSEDLALRYAHFPDQALASDETLHILHILDHLRALMRENKLELALEKAVELAPALDKINEDLLRLLAKGLERKPVSSGEQKDVGSNLLLEKYEDAQYRFEHFFKQRKRLARASSQIEEELEAKRASYLELKRELIGLVQLHYHVDLTIS